MKHSARPLPLSVALSAARMFAGAPVHATDGGHGRPITGLQATPYAGVVPPTPGSNAPKATRSC